MASDDGMTLDELQQLVDDMRSDWETFNRILNTQATAFGWCGEYEERMQLYNAETKVLKMHGRVPKGTQISVRNAFAARRIIMGHIISTFQRYGLELPENCWGGVVRDHRALADSYAALVDHLNKTMPEINKEQEQ